MKDIKNKFIKNINFYIQRCDLPVLFSLLSVIIIGIIAVISTSAYTASRTNQNNLIYIKKILFYIPIGLSLLFGIQYFKPKQIRNISTFALIILIIMMFLTLLNPSTKGANRWIDLKILKIQPSEFLKPIFAIIIAMILTKIKFLNKTTNIKKFFKNKSVKNYTILLFSILIIVLGGVILQKDFSMFLTYACIFGAELLLTGINLKYIFVLAILGGGAILSSILFIPHVKKRIYDFFYGSYQASKSELTITNSSLLFGGHDNNFKKDIPDLHTDFIFTGIIEDFGGVIAIILILIFTYLLLHLFMKIYKKTDNFTIYSSVGILTYFTYQIFVHIASNLGLIPIDGITLPFVSYGGSSFISSCIGIGILLSLIKNGK